MPNTPIEINKSPVKPDPAVHGLWQSFRSEMDRLFDRFDDGFGLPSVRHLADLKSFWNKEKFFGVALPAVDVVEDEKSFKITAELPGLEEKDIELCLLGDELILKGEKSRETEEQDKDHYLSERCYGAFQRSFRLPDTAETDKIAADFAKGVLTITVPKAPGTQAAPKKIAVKAA